MHRKSCRQLCTMIAASCMLSACGDDSGRSYDCSVFPPSQSSAYILPWHIGHTYVASPHAARESGPQQYAIDVPMPIGTEILAIRAGVVIELRESFVDYDNAADHFNFVLVRHEDNTVASYIHLTHMGALVDVGASVEQGAVIGLSGHTGSSTEPHLHFDLRPASGLPFETVPLNFRNAQTSGGDLSCGLRLGVRYTALPY
jgi:murein DD-endopeptidase MepM/ murein hydrolase activator NlpD